MSRFIPGDYVRPTHPSSGLPRGSVWVVRYYNSAIGAVELDIVDTGPCRYPPSYVRDRVFSDRNFEKVILCSGQWFEVNEHRLLPVRVADDGAPNLQQIPKSITVESTDKLVERAAATLGAAKEFARKTREEAKALAKAEAKREAVYAAAKKAYEERLAISASLRKDRDRAAATVDLIAELHRLHNGGREQDAAASIAMHVEQLQPLAKSYGYRIAKPGVIAIVVKA